LKKDNALEDFVKNNRDGGPTIIFANTKRKVEEIYNKLSDRNLKADYIHSDLSQSRRTRVFNKFRDRRISFLIATDVAARGLDIKGVSYVINYDFPQTDEFYIHRVGRTGRAGMVGKAITYINSIKEKKSLFSISEKKNFELMNADPEGREIIDHKREISGKKDRDS
jgi:ATP-dependent RNA helicase DeaD